MNKLSFFVLILALVAGGATFAEAKAKVADGTVVSYTAADTAKGTPAVLVVKVGKKEETFVIDAKTVATGKDKKPADLATVKAGTKVEVKFTEDAKKVLTAVSVTVK